MAKKIKKDEDVEKISLQDKVGENQELKKTAEAPLGITQEAFGSIEGSLSTIVQLLSLMISKTDTLGNKAGEYADKIAEAADKWREYQNEAERADKTHWRMARTTKSANDPDHPNYMKMGIGKDFENINASATSITGSLISNYKDNIYTQNEKTLREAIDGRSKALSKKQIEKLGFDEHTYKNTVNKIMQTELGTLQHAQQEVISKFKAEFGDKDGVLNIEDLKKVKAKGTKAKRINDLLDEYQEALDVFDKIAGATGFKTRNKGKDYKGAINFANTATAGTSQIIRDMGGTILGTEMGLGMEVYNAATGETMRVAGKPDTVFYTEDDDYIHMIDNKTGNISKEDYVAQQQMYGLMLKTMQNRLKTLFDGKNLKDDNEVNRILSENGIFFNEDDSINANFARKLLKAKGFKSYLSRMDEHGSVEFDNVDLSTKAMKNANRLMIEYMDKILFGDGATDESKQALVQLFSPFSNVTRTGMKTEGSDKAQRPKTEKKPPTVEDSDFKKFMRQYLSLQRKMDANEVNADRATRRGSATGLTEKQRGGYAKQVEAIHEENKALKEVQDTLYANANLTDEQKEELNKQLDILAKHKKVAMAANEANMPKNKGGFLGQIFGEFKQSAAYLTRVSIIYGLIGKIKQALSGVIKEVQKMDAAITKLQIVTKSSRKDLESALKSYNNLASELKVSSDTVLQAAEDWLRAGYSIEQSNKLIEASVKLSTLGMMEAKDATTALISVLKGWKLDENQISGVVDQVTALDSAFATTARDITTAMQKANVSAGLSGMSLTDFESYVTTVLDTSQLSAETVGTAFKTLIARMGNVKAGKYTKEYDEEQQGGESGKYNSLNDTEVVLSKVGIRTRDSASNFRDMNLILEDIAKKWNTLDEVTQNAITTAMAGTRQREALNVLFENWDSVEKAKGVIEGSEGTADAKYAQYAQSIEAASNEFKAAIQTYIVENQNLIKIGKGIIQIATNLVKSLQLIGGPLAIGLLTKYLPKISNGLFGTESIFQGLGRTMESSKDNLIYGVKNIGPRFKEKLSSWFPGKEGVARETQGRKLAEFEATWDKVAEKEGLDTVKLIGARDFLTKGVGGNLGALSGMSDAERSTWFKNFKNLYGKVDLSKIDADRVEKALNFDEITKANREAQIGLYGYNKNNLNETILLTDKEREAFKGLEGNALIEKASEMGIVLDENTRKIIENSNANQAEAEASRAAAEANTDEAAAIRILRDAKARGDGSYEALLYSMKNGGISDEDLKSAETLMKNGNLRNAGGKVNPLDKETGVVSAKLGGALSMLGMTLGTLGSTGTFFGKSTAEAAKGAGASDAGASTLSTITSMLPMLGMAFGWKGALAGGIISVVTNGFANLLDGITLTNKELQENTNAIKQASSAIQDKMREQTDAEKDRKTFYQQSTEVNLSTGENISLSADEFSEYQSTLDKIADTVSGIYVHEDENGNKILKQGSQTIDVITAYEDYLQAIKDNTLQEAQKQLEDMDINEKINQVSQIDASNSTYLTGSEKANLYNDQFPDDPSKRVYYDSSSNTFKTSDGKEIDVNNYLKTNSEAQSKVQKEKQDQYRDLAWMKIYAEKSYYDLDDQQKEFLHGYVEEISKGNYADFEIDKYIQQILSLLTGENGIFTDNLWKLKKIDKNTQPVVEYSKVQLTDPRVVQDAKYQLAKENARIAADNTGYPEGSGMWLETYIAIMKDEYDLVPTDVNLSKAEFSYSSIDNVGDDTQHDLKVDSSDNFFDQGALLLVSKFQYEGSLNNAQNINGQMYLPFSSFSSGLLTGNQRIYNLDQPIYINKNNLKYIKKTDGDYFAVDENAVAYDAASILEASSQFYGTVVDDTAFLDKHDTARVKAGRKIFGDKSNDQKSQKLFGDFWLPNDDQTKNGTGITITDVDTYADTLKPYFKKKYGGEMPDKLDDADKEYIYDTISRLKFSPSTNAAQLFSTIQGLFQSQGGLTYSNAEMLDQILNNKDFESIKNSQVFQDYIKYAKDLGLAFDGTANSLKRLTDNLQFLGDIDVFGQTNKTLAQVKSQFESIGSLIEDISDNSRLSLDNLNTILTDENLSSALVQYLDGTEAGIQKLSDALSEMYSLQAVKESAVLLTAKNKDYESYKRYMEQTEADKRLGAFGNLNEAQTIYALKDKHGVAKDYYSVYDKKYDSKQFDEDFAKSNSYVRDLVTAFGLGDKATSADLKEALYDRLKKSGAKVSYNNSLGEMISQFKDLTDRGALSLDVQVMAAKSKLESLQSTLKIRQDEATANAVNNAVNKAKTKYDSGKISRDVYIQSLQNARAKAPTDEIRDEIDSNIREEKIKNIDSLLEKGQIKASEYREQLSDIIHTVTEGTDKYDELINKYLQSFDKEIQRLTAEANLLPDKIKTQEELYAKQANYDKQSAIYREKLNTLAAAGRKESEEFLQTQKALYEVEKQRVEAEKELLDYLIQQEEKQLSAYTTIADYASKQLEDRKKLIDEVYQKEIEALEQANEQRQKSIELTKLQNELDNAKKEKKRVYVAGIGFTYRSDAGKLKEARQNLQDYNQKNQIEALKTAQANVDKHFQQLLDDWNDVKDIVEHTKSQASATEAAIQLLGEGGTIDDAMKFVREGEQRDVYGHIESLGNTYALLEKDYLKDKKALAIYDATIDGKLDTIKSTISGIGSTITSESSKIATAISGASSQTSVNVSIPSLDALKTQIANANKYLNQLLVLQKGGSYDSKLAARTVTNSSTGPTSNDPTTSNKKINKVVSDAIFHIGSQDYALFQSQTSGKYYLAKSSDVVTVDGEKYVAKGSYYYMGWSKLDNALSQLIPGYSTGIENGPVTQTGLAMLHGSKSSPEYVLNSEQAYTLLKNLATMDVGRYQEPGVSKYHKPANENTTYSFGSINLPDGGSPDQFFNELLRVANSQFGVNKKQI